MNVPINQRQISRAVERDGIRVNGYMKAFVRYWYVILVATVAGAGVTWAVTPENLAAQPQPVASYTATATLLVGYPVQDPTETPAEPMSMARVELFVTSGDVPKNAAKVLGSTEAPAVLAAKMTVNGDSEADALTISNTDGDAATAELRANTFADEAVKYFKKNQSRSTPRLTVLQRATAIPNMAGNAVVLPPSRALRAAMGGILGLLLGFSLALLLANLDSRLRTREEVYAAMRTPVVAEVPKLKRVARKRREITVLTAPLSPYSDSYRGVRSAILHMPSGVISGDWTPKRSVQDATVEVPTTRAVLITSGHASDGKTTSVANLAASFAETGLTVLVLDADVRKPDMHLMFDVPQGSGLSDFVESRGQASIASLIRPTKVPGVSMITAGSTLEHPETLPARLGPIIEQARGLADIVLVDAAPILAANDVFDLLPLVDTVLLVVRSGRLSEASGARIAELLGRFQVSVTGIMLIAPPRRRNEGRGYGYGYGYGEAKDKSEAARFGKGRGPARVRSEMVVPTSPRTEAAAPPAAAAPVEPPAEPFLTEGLEEPSSRVSEKQQA
ncbi:MAG: P-loop NTPase [Micropruina sp.]|nr:P-loop NTPase [Micropruina sp.]